MKIEWTDEEAKAHVFGVFGVDEDDWEARPAGTQRIMLDGAKRALSIAAPIALRWVAHDLIRHQAAGVDAMDLLDWADELEVGP